MTTPETPAQPDTPFVCEVCLEPIYRTHQDADGQIFECANGHTDVVLTGTFRELIVHLRSQPKERT